MSVPVALTTAARREYNEAFDWYEQARAGAGVAFARRVQDVLARISAHPRLNAIVFKDARKAVVRPYPYCVYYRELPGIVEVIAVFHTSRDPTIWQSRA